MNLPPLQMKQINGKVHLEFQEYTGESNSKMKKNAHGEKAKLQKLEKQMMEETK